MQTGDGGARPGSGSGPNPGSEPSGKAAGTADTLPAAMAAARMLTVALGVLLLCSFAGSAPGASSRTLPGLHVSGKRLLDSKGRVVRWHGVNRSGSEYACIQGWGVFDGPSDAASVKAMTTWHINAVRIPHTMPPRSLLDAARRHGLRAMVGLSAEQYLGFLIDRKKTLSEIEMLVRVKVRECAGHPALLCYALGNEIPASVARWLGRRTIERYLERLYRAVKIEDPDGLVTYVNYPTTEYLQLPFLDLVCFNVYLESRSPFDAYLDRLQMRGELLKRLSEDPEKKKFL